jgi:hypothetical protein
MSAVSNRWEAEASSSFKKNDAHGAFDPPIARTGVGPNDAKNRDAIFRRSSHCRLPAPRIV